ncbi:TPA: antirestriction protein ArdA [Clostridioides difficile]|nr:antirestriction protein ArdA [Clostridioides difficile]MCW0877838.1 antirestriction protein ArdA [Clostridioides difficile]MDE3719370.1 antirestriction protein ArdA [Clostridioides difficile]MDS6447130.1 antirestriction protein ArdA [Clostridioides difficile]HCQ6017569.1 antirestriction protein ArdA [Clostridioides difficile]
MAKNFMKNNAVTKLENIKNEVQKSELKEQEQFRIEYIHIDDIVPSKKNFYSIDDESISELADSILEVGLLHNLLVRPNIKVFEMILRVYIADLEAYENGELIGKWLRLPEDEEKIEKILEGMGNKYFIKDYITNIEGLDIEGKGINELNELAKNNQHKKEFEMMLKIEVSNLDTYENANECTSKWIDLPSKEETIKEALEYVGDRYFISDYVTNLNIKGLEDKKISELNELAKNLIDGLEYEKYELLSGERRYRAHKRLVELGYKKFQLIPCQVMSLDDVDAEIALISANAHNRPLTDYEKLKETQKLIDLHKLKKANGEKVTGIHNAVSEKLKLKPTQTKRYVTMAKNLIPELEKMLELEKLSVSNASIFSALSKENQRALYQSLKDKDDMLEITKKEAEDLKNRYKDLEEEKNIIEKSYIDKIEQLTKEKELKEKELKEATNGINEKIEMIKKEMETKIKVKTDGEIGEYLEEIEQLEKEKKELEIRHKEIKEEQEIKLEKIKEEQQELVLKAREEVKLKAEHILQDFEEDKKRLKEENEKIKLENEKLKKVLDSKDFDDREKKAIYETKITLTKLKSDVIRVTSLMKNIPSDEEILKDIESLQRLFKTLESTIEIHAK